MKVEETKCFLCHAILQLLLYVYKLNCLLKSITLFQKCMLFLMHLRIEISQIISHGELLVASSFLFPENGYNPLYLQFVFHTMYNRSRRHSYTVTSLFVMQYRETISDSQEIFGTISETFILH